MKVSIEVSYYPLTEGYEDIIISFIRRMQEYEDIDVVVNGFSTQLYGEYDHVTSVLMKEMKKDSNSRKGMFVMKLCGGDLSGPVTLNS